MDNERNQRRFESVFSRKVRAGKRRTYFFDVRQTKGDDYYLTLTESTRKFNGDGYERHKIFLYKEDFNRFLDNLQDVIDHIKTNLMPEYDYDEFARRHDEDEEDYMDDHIERHSAPFSENHTSKKRDGDALPSEEDMTW
ncbi:MAG: DUF3276 family protein [Haliscomenobacter sp.]|nr:DUF3276 family protein [Haliscomenobacter sp.]MBK8652663.1 DUF3276 family protein [Haliscomenobacter sp.]MBP9075350.1 DUF3276 family protein [Haliscomenobacter sp.]MBP9873313.1 DUF3276 family protein [Haliscomenobacter sp.]